MKNTTTRCITGWREKLRQKKQIQHSNQFAKARMPGKEAQKLHKSKQAWWT